MAFENETSFIDGLKTTPDQKTAIEALFNDPDFKRIWDYLKNCSKVIVLRIVPGYKIDGVERFGGYTAGRKGDFCINPTKPEHRNNPMEMVDTIIHECIHAVMDLRADCGEQNFPFGNDVTDLRHDPTIQGTRTRHKNRTDPRDKGHLDDHYGDSASAPNDEYIDINDKAQQLIIRIIRRLRQQTGVGDETLTFENERKRNPPPPPGNKGCFGVLVALSLLCALLLVAIL
ncbi:MAG TPA: hypothetical protein PKW08_01555 [Flavobacteriaceae bacterium]|nr:hypothetical protein [Flavobacteriaceae bacterium]MCB9212499.1 hypothetical protein [Alteromonas sp.]HPF10562.1 hypothetical protein [Flavobacteriaceae bacterium]HQU20250.1 hypothetical protein [Flavobacteriaceae bacterium]HQU66008.1 hypothetical protein [Flavobacteriaceae bacterium]